MNEKNDDDNMIMKLNVHEINAMGSKINLKDLRKCSN